MSSLLDTVADNENHDRQQEFLSMAQSDLDAAIATIEILTIAIAEANKRASMSKFIGELHKQIDDIYTQVVIPAFSFIMNTTGSLPANFIEVPAFGGKVHAYMHVASDDSIGILIPVASGITFTDGSFIVSRTDKEALLDAVVQEVSEDCADCEVK